MNCLFKIEYHTQWGEELRIVGNIPELGNNDTASAIPLSTQDGRHWELLIETNVPPLSKGIHYNYLIFKDKVIIKQEYHLIKHELTVPSKGHLLIEDAWIDKPNVAPLYSSAFTKVWYKREPAKCKLKTSTHELAIIEANIKPTEVLAILGNTEELGCWDIQKAVEMDDSDFPRWKLLLDLSASQAYLLEYKYVILNKKDRSLVEWEEAENRSWLIDQSTHQNSLHIKFEAFTRFKPLPWRTSGVAVPVFSLRSKRSWGIGEFLDIKQLVDWAVLTQQKIIQILPINDTTNSNTWDDAYPYRCISVFALNPIYLNLDELGISDTIYASTYQKDKKRLNQLLTIDYPYVQTKKQTYSHEIFKLKGKDTLDSSSFKEFYKNQRDWLVPYAIYLHLRDKFEKAETSSWGKYCEFRQEWIEEFNTPNYKEYEKIQYTYFIQYHLYQQLRDSTHYANSKGVVLKGDLPIGISLHSADAWTNPKFFHMDCQAGAPPDDFASEGQNWGFPTYNWENIQNDNFSWWKNRLQYMSSFFQAYRIDHILGFFRIWSIPRFAIHGTLGQFSPALPLSVQEIEDFGFSFNKELHAHPYINGQALNSLNAQDKELVVNTFLTPSTSCRYSFKKDFDTQTKLRDYLLVNTNLNFSDDIEPLLMTLHTQVLFVEDLKQTNLFHPRIDAFKTSIYRILNDKDKLAFDILYHDYFYERHNLFWKNEALHKLPQLIDASDMLVCGEDLGMIPKTVPEVMNTLDILSLEVQRMPKGPGESIATPHDYPYLSVSTFSTHDMSTMRGWWEDNRNQALELYQRLEVSNEPTPQKLSPDLAYSILNRDLCGRSMLVIEALQDWMALTSEWYETLSGSQEQINVPANIKHHWKFRMAGYLEELIDNKDLNTIINQLVSKK